MLDQLMGLIQDNSQQAIVQNPEIPNSQNTEVMQTLLGSITGGLQQQAQAGNVQGIMGLLSSKETGGGLMNNPIVASIASNAISAITQKFGLSNGAAGGLVASVLPGVIGGLISKVSNPGDSSIDFNSMLGGLLGGGATSNTGSAANSGFDFNQIGYAMADGKLDMNDIMNIGGSFFGSNSNTNSQPEPKKEGLDLGGLLGGLFGK
ncbi:hypothetical protein SAMN04487995_4048 [Dyadobacter koreensis]|uniref:DUF937 domain-containing protein n=1 Tax=Dyadobacter koreensis TaxID=408657 RepID=A0A1H6XY40_9BACT|nr:DUF937 domain-containing protein [Dyadobacter koreensis]SEJ29792.1 hypothetical protein SAMN04487995_4048 [Dyadobacter koreensis]